MGASERAAVLLLLLLGLNQTPLCVTAGKVLVWPVEFSHWLNIKVIIDELIARGHEVTIVTISASPTINPERCPSYKLDIIQVPFTKQDVLKNLEAFVKYWMYDLQNDNIIRASRKIHEIIGETAEHNKILCRELYARKDLVEKWRKEQYDVMLLDPMYMCGDSIALTLNVPIVISLRFSFGSSVERHCARLPTPASYVPGVGLGYTDQMDFPHRVKNVLYNLFQDALAIYFAATLWDPVYTEVMGKPTTVCETMGKADIWLIRTYWDFEYPRPFLPNFKFVGGLHCKPAKPLPKEMEEFAQSSGGDGIVVFSLGSMIKNLTRERANTVAAALGQLPQKVLWRYSGEKPETLAPNTRLYDWIPQNDLLGHPKTKAFVTHGGTNGLYEAIYHGVPMVALPLFGDQSDNVMHMATKGAAIILDINKMDSKDLKEAISEVVTNSSYKEAIMRLSRIHHDQPMKPLDQAVYWIEFVMRNKGAKHLRVAAHELTWYQYHCLDVAAFLLGVFALIVFIFVKTCSWIFRKCCRRATKKSKKE